MSRLAKQEHLAENTVSERLRNVSFFLFFSILGKLHRCKYVKVVFYFNLL